MKLRKCILTVLLFLLAMPSMAQISKVLKPRILLSGLKDASSLYAAPSGLLFIAETGKNRVLVVSSTGERVDSLGNTGMGNNQFDTPMDVDATNGLKIYVADYNNHRIRIYDRHFQYLTTIDKSSSFDRDTDYEPTKLCVNNRGELFFYDDNSGDIIKYNSRGEYDQKFIALSDEISNPPSFMLSIDDRIYIGDPYQGVVHIISNDGRYIGFFGGVKNISGIAKGENHLWMLTPGLLKVFTVNGHYIKTYNISETKYVRGLAIYVNKIFFLTKDKLLYLQMSDFPLLENH